MTTVWKRVGIHNGFREANEAGGVSVLILRFLFGIDKDIVVRDDCTLSDIDEPILHFVNIGTIFLVTVLPVFLLARYAAVESSVTPGTPLGRSFLCAIRGVTLDVLTARWQARSIVGHDGNDSVMIQIKSMIPVIITLGSIIIFCILVSDVVGINNF